MGYVTVSAKIDRELYEKVKRLGVPVSRVIRRALEEEVRVREEEEVRGALGRAQEILRKIPSEEMVGVVRAGREER
nr:type II toxin-antitoxin system CcdA family antitoxin [Candidatus Freyrarchaeum guaymaensis]